MWRPWLTVSMFVSLINTEEIVNSGNYGDYNIDKNGNPFAFHMFENADVLQQVFLTEHSFIKDLAQVREILSERRDTLRSLNQTFVDRKVSRNDEEWREVKERIESSTAEVFPNSTDFEGAVNGLVLLYDTYKFDVGWFLKGKIVIYNIPQGEIISIDSKYNVSLTDLFTLAEHAYSKTWYDDTIQFLRTYLDTLPTLSPDSRPRPEQIKKADIMRRNLVHLNNQYITKKRVMVDKHFKVLPYVIDDKLKKKTKQPKVLTQGEPVSFVAFDSSQGKESYFRSVCQGFSARPYQGIPEEITYCRYLHHDDPYLRLGPFKYETASEEPFIVLFHDLFTDLEMKYMVDVSRPNLSRARYTEHDNVGQLHEFKSGKKRRIVHKTVQHWMTDIVYNLTIEDPLVHDNDFRYFIMDKVLFKLSKKLELATGLNLTSKYASTQYQTTNYGLAGLCETHVDPHGFLEGAELPPSRKGLIMSGDMFGTVMGWIEDEPIGGATAFVTPPYEVTVWPRKGSAAFWFSLDRRGFRDGRTTHGGCPVLKGSKWIMNKWIYFYDQVKKYPCGLTELEYVEPFTGHY